MNELKNSTDSDSRVGQRRLQKAGAETKRAETNHRFNILDVILILMAIAAIWLVIAVYSPTRIFGDSGKKVQITYTVEIIGVDPALAGSIAVGDEVVNAENFNIGRVIAEAEVAPYQIVSYDPAAGEVIMSDHPDLVNLLITMSATVSSDDVNGYNVSGQRIAVGRNITLVMSAFEGAGQCIGINEVGATEGGAK